MQQHKAHHLYRWARDAGKPVSRDEVADMVRRYVTRLPMQSCMLYTMLRRNAAWSGSR